MNQKNYWLRGGVIGVALNIILTGGIILLAPFLGEGALFLSYTIIPYVSPYYFGVSSMGFLPGSIANPYTGLLIPVVIYFFIGAIIGGIYGKFKNK